MSYLSALSNYLPDTETVLKASDKCEEILFPLAAHCILGLVSVGTAGLAFKISGQGNLFSAELNNRLANLSILDEEFTQKFFKKSVTQVPLFRIISLQIPFIPILRLMGTTERAHALGQSLLNTSTKILSFWSLLTKITLVVTGVFIATVSIKALLLDYDWGKWRQQWEKHRIALTIHAITAISLILLTLRIPYCNPTDRKLFG